MTDEFWKRKSLQEMTAGEWESLCDGCALCCLNKLEDEDTGSIYYTDLACRLLELDSCRCTDYANRNREVPDCMVLKPSRQAEFDWLPPTCAYRRLARGQDLPAWHPLLTGDPMSVHAAGISLRGRMLSERDSDEYRVIFQFADGTEEEIDASE